MAIENLALRQQLGIALRSGRRVKLRKWDRLFWVVLRRCWGDWQKCLVIVQPETVCRWQATIDLAVCCLLHGSTFREGQVRQPLLGLCCLR